MSRARDRVGDYLGRVVPSTELVEDTLNELMDKVEAEHEELLLLRQNEGRCGHE